MEFSLFFIAAILLFRSVVAQVDILVGFNGDERDALYALKKTFNDSFLNRNWTGTHCHNNQPPLWYGLQCGDGRVTAISLDSLGLVGNMNINAFNKFTELSALSLKNNSLSGNVFNFTSNKKMKAIDLSSNAFDGPIPDSLVSLSSLESLQLQNNKLTGSIPELNQSSLAVFNVSNNNIKGFIPRTKALQSFGPGSYRDNPGLCGPPSDVCNSIIKGSNNTAAPPDSNKATNDNSSSKAHVILLLVLVIVLFFVANLLLLLLYFKKHLELKELIKQLGTNETKEKKNESVTEISIQNQEPAADEGGKLIFMEEGENFQLGDLLKASAEGLGKGIFGNSYKAMLEGRSPIVVKRLRDLKPLTVGEFMKQVQLIAKLRHPNLLPLVAYFYTKEEKLLLYKYAEKGNLFDRIHGGRGVGRVPFRWSSRLIVAQGVARALEFLHFNSKPNSSSIPHGNLKSSNVLLGENDEVLVSDYGFASLVALPIAAQCMVSYRSPEYQQMKRVSRKSDVWSFGCLLIELLTGKISSHSAPEESHGIDLCAWVNRAVREEWTAEIFDSEIASQRSAIPGMLNLLQIAIRCSNISPDKRPEMSEVVKEVENIKLIENGDEYSSSFDRSLTDDSMSTVGSGIAMDER
ncbi:probable leucine-rich repeat receptor-like protein kinase At1g68400 [Benincasa hispida]|uniref:probable leucine-rich repeat receptor-like protein kinase At1g68400 n=1 Tax=Benincasa hispida TaxID=102211 RepID=UPI0019023861|nr:probable leucine-rich repeat receptor-like protein kinase At1g68400 [Benincasa hispida]